MCESGRRLPHIYLENTMTFNASNPDYNICVRGWSQYGLPCYRRISRPRVGGQPKVRDEILIGRCEHRWGRLGSKPVDNGWWPIYQASSCEVRTNALQVYISNRLQYIFVQRITFFNDVQSVEVIYSSRSQLAPFPQTQC